MRSRINDWIGRVCGGPSPDWFIWVLVFIAGVFVAAANYYFAMKREG